MECAKDADIRASWRWRKPSGGFPVFIPMKANISEVKRLAKSPGLNIILDADKTGG